MKLKNVIAGFLRIFQFILAIVLLGINGRLQVNTSSLSNIATLLQTTLTSGDLDSLDLDSFWKTNPVALGTSAWTILTHAILTFVPKLFGGRDQKTVTNSKGEVSITTGQKTYLFSISISEVVSLLLWFTTCVYFTSKFGDWNCSSTTELIYQYNLTSPALTQALNDFWGISHISANDTIADGVDEYQYELNQLLANYFNITENSDLAAFNISAISNKQELLLKLSQDCQIKKASIGLSYVGFFAFLGSTWLVSFTGTKFYEKYTAAKSSQKTDSESQTTSGSNEKGATTSTSADNSATNAAKSGTDGSTETGAKDGTPAASAAPASTSATATTTTTTTATATATAAIQAQTQAALTTLEKEIGLVYSFAQLFPDVVDDLSKLAVK